MTAGSGTPFVVVTVSVTHISELESNLSFSSDSTVGGQAFCKLASLVFVPS